MIRPLTVLSLLLALSAHAQQEAGVPPGYWSEAQADEILARTATIRLAPDLSSLGAEERSALADLIEAGTIMQKLYESSRHHQALAALDRLRVLDVKLGQPAHTQKLLSLYRLNQGPIAATPDNRRAPFLPVDEQRPGRNVYPVGATREELDAWLGAHPEARDEILGERTVVRRNTQDEIGNGTAVLNAFAVLRELHPGLLGRLRELDRSPDGSGFHAVPYAVAYADQLVPACRLLMRAASKLEPSDPELARYLRNRARDLISNDYESGDASWVTGRFRKLNAQIGAYETYDDALYGVKAFHGMSILLADEKATEEMRKALGSLQAVEDALPYENHKRVRDDIPVGVYHVIADFGQARGTNTATILPNDPLFSRRYGRTILLRGNIMRHPDIFAAHLAAFRAATADAHRDDLRDDGDFLRTLWHEIGHYLGVDRDRRGRTLDIALEEYADSIEEMKSDLVSLFALQKMKHPSLRSVQAAGIRRTLQNVRPRSDQPYQTMQLIQYNWFVEEGLLVPDPATARLTVNYDRYPDAVATLLAEVLDLQHEGDKARAKAFLEKWTTWSPLHEKLAERIRTAEEPRWRIVKYAALGE